MKENGLALKNVRSRRYPAETITDSVYVDDLALLANTPASSEPLPHSLEQTSRGVGLHVNANKTDFMCFKREGAISTLSGRPLKLIDKRIYLGRNISSTESGAKIRLEKGGLLSISYRSYGSLICPIK